MSNRIITQTFRLYIYIYRLICDAIFAISVLVPKKLKCIVIFETRKVSTFLSVLHYYTYSRGAGRGIRIRWNVEIILCYRRRNKNIYLLSSSQPEKSKNRQQIKKNTDFYSYLSEKAELPGLSIPL